MKFLVFFACALAVASAGYPYYASPYAQHVPVIDHNGVPLDTPEVQAARANHFAAHAAAKYGGYLAVGYTGHGVPAITADGQPIDTPEVQLARAAHFIAYNQAAYQNAYPHAAIAAGPVETPEVQIAKAAHFAAHAEAKARSGHYRRRRSPGYAYPQALPAIGNNGVPLDTPEVEAAKASHFAAHSRLSSNSHAPAQPGPYPAYSGPSYNGFAGYHVPVIGPNGVPTETPEVQSAKASHYAALSKSAASGYQGGNQGGNQGGYQGGYQGAYQGPYAGSNFANGAPQDTPEVQAAKQAHFAAHASSGGQRYY